MKRDLIISFIDQLLLSLANFGVGLLLIKWTTKLEYGLYVLAYAIIMYIVGIQNALVTTQMTVLAPKKNEMDRTEYIAGLATGQIFLAFAISFIVTIMANCFYFLGYLNSDRLIFIIIIAISSIGVLSKEFQRSYYFLYLKPLTVLSIDFLQIIMMFGALFWAKLYFVGNLPLVCISILGVSCLTTTIIFILLRSFRVSTNYKTICSSFKENWINGKWSLGGMTITWLQDQSYIYLLAMAASTANVAEANAAKLFLSPIAMINVSFGRTLMPRWSHMLSMNNIMGIRSTARKAAIWMSLIIIFYVAAIIFAKDIIITQFMTKEYSEIGPLILLWGIWFLIQTNRANSSWCLQVFSKFRQLTFANMISALVVIVSSIVLISLFGVQGSIISLIIGEAIFAYLMKIIFYDVVRNAQC